MPLPPASLARMRETILISPPSSLNGALSLLSTVPDNEATLTQFSTGNDSFADGDETVELSFASFLLFASSKSIPHPAMHKSNNVKMQKIQNFVLHFLRISNIPPYFTPPIIMPTPF
jgi:hypothetical protein